MGLRIESSPVHAIKQSLACFRSGYRRILEGLCHTPTPLAVEYATNMPAYTNMDNGDNNY
jgi:hypothetical protein